MIMCPTCGRSFPDRKIHRGPDRKRCTGLIQGKPSLGRRYGRGWPGRGQGRKAICGEPMRTTSVTLPAELLERIADLGLTFPGLGSEVVRSTLELYLSLLEDPAEVFDWLDVACAPAGDPPRDVAAWVHQVRSAITLRA